MNIHEYQAKQILRDCKISVPDGSVASSVTEAIDKAICASCVIAT